MDIFPAIDLKNGQCVRLTKGDFDAVTVYESDPVKQAQKFLDAGATWLHMVDLDGAKAGEPRQHDIIADVVKSTSLNVQVGGGIRDGVGVQKLLDAGVTRVVVGSLAVKNPALVRDWLRDFGADKIVLALDVKLDESGEPEVLTHGWQQGSQILMWDILKTYEGSGLKTVLCTDIGRDGMLTGTNHALYRAMRTRCPDLDILASGGVKDQDDILALAPLGVAGVIVGKAIYEGKVDLKACLQQVEMFHAC